jgi:hypothetical protein
MQHGRNQRILHRKGREGRKGKSKTWRSSKSKSRPRDHTGSARTTKEIQEPRREHQGKPLQAGIGRISTPVLGRRFKKAESREGRLKIFAAGEEFTPDRNAIQNSVSIAMKTH